MLSQVVPRTLINNLLVAVLFGVLVPYVKGIEYLDLFLLLPYSFLGLFFVVPLAIDAIYAAPTGDVPLGAIFRAMGTGWFTGVVVLWLGIATVSVRHGRLTAPPPAVALALAVMSLFACVFMGALAAWTARNTANAATAKGRLRIGFLFILVAFFALPRVLDEDTMVALLGYLTPEGLVKATLVLAPLESVAAVVLLTRLARR